MNRNELNADNVYTLNGLVKVLGYNRNTIEKKVNKGDYPITSIMHNNRSYPAYIVTPEQLQKIDFEVAQNKGNAVAQVKRSKGNTSSGYKQEYIGADATAREVETEGVYNGYNNGMLRIVKNTEGVNELVQGKLREAELQNEIADYKVAVSRLEADKLQVETKLLMIEDKSRTLEGEVARLGQELKQEREDYSQTLKRIEGKLSQRNYVIIGLCAVILCALTILLTINFTR